MEKINTKQTRRILNQKSYTWKSYVNDDKDLSFAWPFVNLHCTVCDGFHFCSTFVDFPTKSPPFPKTRARNPMSAKLKLKVVEGKERRRRRNSPPCVDCPICFIYLSHLEKGKYIYLVAILYAHKSRAGASREQGTRFPTSSSHATKNSVWKIKSSSSKKLNSKDWMSCPSAWKLLDSDSSTLIPKSKQ